MSRAKIWFEIIKRPSARLEPEVRARRLRLIGRYYHATSDYELTIRWTRRAYRQFEVIGNQKGTFQCLRTLFSAYMYSSRYERARECAALILENPECPGVERLKMLSNLGNLEHRLNRYFAARDHFAEALKLLSADLDWEAAVRYNLANVQVCLNQFSEAEDNYHQALTLFAERGEALHQAYVQQALAYLYVILGQYFQGEKRLFTARQLYLDKEDSVGAALCDLDRFHLKIRLNQNREAMDEANRLTEVFQNVGLAYETGLILFYAMRASLAEGELTLAERFLERAGQIFEKERNLRFQGLCQMYHGLLFARQGEVSDALDAIDGARELFVAEKQGEQELFCLVHRFRLTGKLSRDLLRRAKTLLAEPVSHEARTHGLMMVSEYWYGRGQIKKAVESRFEAVMTIEEARASITSEETRALFFGDKVEIYEGLIEWLFRWRNPRASELIFKILELSRGRQLAERISKLESLPPVINQDQTTLLEKNRLGDRLAQLNRKLSGFSKDYGVNKVEKEAALKAYRASFQEMEGLKLRMRDQARLGIYFPIDLTASEVQRYLPNDCLVISYFLRDQHLYRVELDAERLRTHSISLYPAFRRDLNLLFRILSNRLPNRESQIAEIVDRIGAVLLPKNIGHCKQLIFIPHRKLESFPFSLLKSNQRLILETHRITICHSLPMLYFALKRKASPLRKPLFFFSDSAEDPAAGEREPLRGMYPRARVENTLRPKFLRSSLAETDFIHFAGHCGFNPHQPSRSHLRLAGGRIYLRNLRSIQLNGPFINLASCRSGSVVLKVGNEPHGFVPSLFAAGASNILAGLWDLDDKATSAWMKLFYENIHEGLGDAYRRSCLTMHARGVHPSDWAGFWLLGKPE